MVLTDLAEFTHFVTRVKIVPAVADDLALIEVERTRGRGFAEKLSMRVLSRTWQMLLKGIAEVAAATTRFRRPRWCWCASPMLPIFRRPDELLRSLDDKRVAYPRAGLWRRTDRIPTHPPPQRLEAPSVQPPPSSLTGGVTPVRTRDPMAGLVQAEQSAAALLPTASRT